MIPVTFSATLTEPAEVTDGASFSFVTVIATDRLALKAPSVTLTTTS